MSTRTLILIAILAFLLTACATPPPTSAPVLSATPTSAATETAAPLPTLTPTAAATAIPATPEYAGELRYDPETRALNNLQGTPVFTLWVDGAWKGLTPEMPAEIMAGYPDVRIEEGDDGVSYLMVGEDGSEEEEMIGFSDPNQKDGWATIDEITRDQVPEWGEMPFKIEEHDGNYYGMSESNMTMSGEEAMSVYNLDTHEWEPYIKNVFQENLIVMGDYVNQHPDEIEEIIENNMDLNEARLLNEDMRIRVEDGNLDFGFLYEEGDKPKWVDFSAYIVGTHVQKDADGKDAAVWIVGNIPGEIKDQGVVFCYRRYEEHDVKQYGVYLFDKDNVFSDGEYKNMKKEMVHISPTHDEVFQFFANSENIIGQQMVFTTQVNNKPGNSYEKYNDETEEWIDGMKIGDWWSGREVGLYFSGAYLPENAWKNK